MNEGDQTPLPINQAEPTDLDAITGGIVAGLDRNEAAASNAAKTAPVDQERQTAQSSGYELTASEAAEPIRNFLTDAGGRIRFHSSGPKKGKPMRSPGKPAPAKPGDRLAGGGTAKGSKDQSQTKANPGDHSHVFNPLDPAANTGPADQSADTAINQSNEPDDAAGEVVIDAFLTCMESIDERNKATNAERESMKKAARKTFGNFTVPGWVVLLLVGGLYWTRTQLIRAKDKANDGSDGKRGDAHPVRGNDTHGKNNPDEKDHGGGGITW